MIGSPKLLCADDSIKIYTSSLLLNEHVVSQALSLNDPASLQRMQVPCRSFDCHHLQCFDFSVIKSLNRDCSAEGSFFKCSVCNERRNPNKIYVDFVALGLLRLYKSSDSFKLYRDGTLQTSGSISPDFANFPINSIFDVKRLCDLDCFQSTAISIGVLHYTSVYDMIDYINKSSTPKLLGLISRYGKTTAKKDAEISACIEKLRPFYATTLSELQHTFRLISGVGEKKSVKIMTDLVKEYEAENYEHLKRITCGPLDAKESMKLITEAITYDVKRDDGVNVMVDLCDDDDDEEIQDFIPSLGHPVESSSSSSSATTLVNQLSGIAAIQGSQLTINLQQKSSNVEGYRQYRSGNTAAFSDSSTASSSNYISQARQNNPTAITLKPKANRVAGKTSSTTTLQNNPTIPNPPLPRIGLVNHSHSSGHRYDSYNNNDSRNNNHPNLSSSSSNSNNNNNNNSNNNNTNNNNNNNNNNNRAVGITSHTSTSAPTSSCPSSRCSTLTSQTSSHGQNIPSLSSSLDLTANGSRDSFCEHVNNFFENNPDMTTMARLKKQREEIRKRSEVIMNPFQALSGMDPKKGCSNSYTCRRPQSTSNLPGGLSNSRVIRGEKIITRCSLISNHDKNHEIKGTMDLNSGILNILSEKHLDMTLRDVLKNLPVEERTLSFLKYLSDHESFFRFENKDMKENECTSIDLNSVTMDIDKDTCTTSVRSVCTTSSDESMSNDGDVDVITVKRKRKFPITILQPSNDLLEKVKELDKEVMKEIEKESKSVVESAPECVYDAVHDVAVSYWTATNTPEKIRVEINPINTDITQNVQDTVHDTTVPLEVCTGYTASTVENVESMYMNVITTKDHNDNDNEINNLDVGEKMNTDHDVGEGFEINSNYSKCSNNSEDKLVII